MRTRRSPRNQERLWRALTPPAPEAPKLRLVNVDPDSRRPERGWDHSEAIATGERVEFSDRGILRGGSLLGGRVYSIGSVRAGSFSVALADQVAAKIGGRT